MRGFVAAGFSLRRRESSQAKTCDYKGIAFDIGRSINGKPSLQLDLDLPLLAFIGKDAHEQIFILSPDLAHRVLERFK
jgi:hypothetical protein